MVKNFAISIDASYNVKKIRLQAIGIDTESRNFEKSLDHRIISSLSDESTINDLRESILSLLCQAEDYDFRDKYTFGVVSVLADGRNAEGSADPDPQYFCLTVLDDFTDEKKAEILAQEFSGKSELERVQQFDTTKDRRLYYIICRKLLPSNSL